MCCKQFYLLTFGFVYRHLLPAFDQAAIQPGEELTVFFDIDSREYQGRWFTNINAWKVERPMAAAPQSAPGAMTPENVVPASAPAASAVPDFGPANPIDDLPF